jgi:lysozyme
MSPEGVARTERHEALRLKPYKDSRGIWTIGIGHNMQADPAEFDHLMQGITEPQARALFAHDIANIEHQLDLYLPWWRTLNQVRQDILAEMGFQLGITKMLKFKNTLAAAKAGKPLDVYAGMMDSDWAKQTPSRVKEMASIYLKGAA